MHTAVASQEGYAQLAGKMTAVDVVLPATAGAKWNFGGEDLDWPRRGQSREQSSAPAAAGRQPSRPQGHAGSAVPRMHLHVHSAHLPQLSSARISVAPVNDGQ